MPTATGSRLTSERKPTLSAVTASTRLADMLRDAAASAVSWAEAITGVDHIEVNRSTGAARGRTFPHVPLSYARMGKVRPGAGRPLPEVRTPGGVRWGGDRSSTGRGQRPKGLS